MSELNLAPEILAYRVFVCGSMMAF